MLGGLQFSVPLRGDRQPIYLAPPLLPRLLRGGFDAVRMLLMTNPLTWLILTILIAAPAGDSPLLRRIVVSVALAVFLPVMIPVWRIAYRSVARNRFRIMPGACAIPPGAPQA